MEVGRDCLLDFLIASSSTLTFILQLRQPSPQELDLLKHRTIFSRTLAVGDDHC
jgi:hypothetical protein